MDSLLFRPITDTVSDQLLVKNNLPEEVLEITSDERSQTAKSPTELDEDLEIVEDVYSDEESEIKAQQG
jgi:predicted methyltransferase